MKIGILGSRSVTDYELFEDVVTEALEQLLNPDEVSTILSGGAKGSDRLAKRYADEWGHDFVLFETYNFLDKKTKFLPKYLFIRNKQVIDNADVMIIVWNGEQGGTAQAIATARSCGKKLAIYNTSKDEWEKEFPEV